MIANRADKADIEMGETLVTQALFKAVMGFNYSAFQSYYDSPQRPVEGVSWFDCISFCNLLSVGLGLEPYYGIRHTRRGYKQSIEYAFVEELGNDGFRLPHVNEWRMFAKAGSENEWPGTNDPAKMNRYGWFGHYEGDDSQSRRVAQLLPNEWGLYDMAGNAWEWCGHPRMTFDDNPLNNREVIGGSYASSLSELKIAFNASRDPAERDSDASFRLCRSGSMKSQKP